MDHTQPIIVTVRNDTSKKITGVDLFGAYKNAFTEHENPVIQNSIALLSHKDVLRILVANTFQIGLVRVTSNKPIFKMPVKILDFTIVGNRVESDIVIKPHKGRVQKSILDYNLKLNLRVTTSFVVEVPAKSTIKFYFFQF